MVQIKASNIHLNEEETRIQMKQSKHEKFGEWYLTQIQMVSDSQLAVNI